MNKRDIDAFDSQIQSKLQELREEVETTCARDSEVTPISEVVYDECASLLKTIPEGVRFPLLDWVEEEGDIELTWLLRDFIVTLNLYEEGDLYEESWVLFSIAWGPDYKNIGKLKALLYVLQSPEFTILKNAPPVNHIGGVCALSHLLNSPDFMNALSKLFEK